MAGLHQRPCVVPPFGFIQVNGKKMAGVVPQERVKANCMLAGKVIENDLVRQRQE